MRYLTFILLVAFPLYGQTRYITHSGAGSHTGTDLGNAWSLDEANTNATTGMVLNMYGSTSTNYTTGIVPPANGITYQRFSDTSQVRIAVGTEGTAIDLSSRSTCVIDGLQVYNAYHFVYATGTTVGNVVKNCRFYNARCFIGFFIEGTSATYWQILYNYIDKADTMAGKNEDALNIQANTSNYNLIKGNTIRRASHTGIQFEASPYVGNSVVDSNYIELCHNGIDVASPSNLVQRNKIFNGNSWYGAAGDALGTKQGNADDNIFRYNAVIDTGMNSNDTDGNGYREIVGIGTGPSAVGGAQMGARMYHNTFYLFTGETVPKQQFWISNDGTTVVADTIGDVKVFNNVIHTGGDDADATPSMKFTQDQAGANWSNWGWTFAGNIVHNEKGTGIVRLRDQTHNEDTLTLAEWKADWGGRVAASNQDADPVYASEASPWDLTPTNVAPQINAAVALTTITTATGSGTSITLADGKFFYGPISGIYDGDSIKIGTGDPVGISTINRSTGAVTIEDSRSWTSGDNVWYYSSTGTADGKITWDGDYPDVGAYELVDPVAPPLAPGAPGILNPTALTKSGFTANWSAVDSVSGYRLDVSTDDFTTYVPGYQDKAVASTSEVITGLSKGTAYTYRVRAYNAVGTSSSSSTAGCTLPRNLRGHR